MAKSRVVALADGPSSWAVPWPCLPEFLAIVTHPRNFRTPTLGAVALDAVGALREAPRLVLLSETAGHRDELRSLMGEGLLAGPVVHDARIAALCRLHGVSELWSADRDFSRFPDLTERNPARGLTPYGSGRVSPSGSRASSSSAAGHAFLDVVDLGETLDCRNFSA